jgi:HEAT repeat protein
MAKAASIEEALVAIEKLRGRALDDQGRIELKRALAGKSKLLVAQAAGVVRALRAEELADDLAAAFDRLLVNGKSIDKGCLAKTAIVQALETLSGDGEAVYLRGVRCVQLEPTWGGTSDTAGELRRASAGALVTSGSRAALTELTDLLADPDVQCRLLAGRLIAHVGSDQGALPLRLKVLLGDSEPDVLEECLLSIIKLTPASGVELAGRFLLAPADSRRQLAIAVLGASRRGDAFVLLRDAWCADISPTWREGILPAIAELRLPEALVFLLSLIENEGTSVVIEAVGALAIYRTDQARQAQISAAVEGRDERGVRDAFAAAFSQS